MDADLLARRSAISRAGLTAGAIATEYLGQMRGITALADPSGFGAAVFRLSSRFRPSASLHGDRRWVERAAVPRAGRQEAAPLAQVRDHLRYSRFRSTAFDLVLSVMRSWQVSDP